MLKPLGSSVKRLPFVITVYCVLLLVATGSLAEERYNRSDFNYHSYKPNTSIGFYTNHSWSAYKKRIFANDKANHVPSCGRVNSSKGSAGPKDFLRRSNDGKGLEYEIVRFCEYVQRYYTVKVEYGLSFEGNDSATFESCATAIQ